MRNKRGVRRTGVEAALKIWVDADACPGAIKEILYRTAKRTQITTTFVANAFLNLPRSPYIEFRKVGSGFDVADKTIVEQLQPGDLVITADIPLAAEVIENGGHALNPRGEMYTTENIRGILNMRDFMDTLRSSGIPTGGPPPLGQGERKAFADSLDRFLARNLRHQ